jgi:hypothetical protein
VGHLKTYKLIPLYSVEETLGKPAGDRGTGRRPKGSIHRHAERVRLKIRKHAPAF